MFDKMRDTQLDEHLTKRDEPRIYSDREITFMKEELIYTIDNMDDEGFLELYDKIVGLT